MPATTAAGTLQITATFVPAVPQGVVGSTSSALTFTVNKAVSTTGLTATGGKVHGNQYQVSMTATVSLNNGRTAVGTVAFYLNGVQVAQVQVGPTGSAAATVPAAKGRSRSGRSSPRPTPRTTSGSTSPTLTVNVK